MASFVFRRARPPDYPAILRLQSENFIANLSEEERTEGFLSAEFSREQVAKLAEDLGMSIATIDAEVVAFLRAFRSEFDHGSPVIAKMLDTYPLVRFDGKPLSSYNSYIYGLLSASIALIAGGERCEDFTKRRSRTSPGNSTSVWRLSRAAIPIL
jgi:sulfur relay (sulfurtransferase) DsrC/TusE family protein